MAKGNLIIPRRNSTTGCSLASYPGHVDGIGMVIFKRGILHEDSSSPILFVLCLIPLSAFLNGMGDGYRLAKDRGKELHTII